jgi:hypothetical protein
MALQEWFDFPFIKLVFRHISGTIVSVLLFSITAWLVKAVMPAGAIRDRIEQVDGIVQLGLLVILAIQLGIALILEIRKQIRGGWNATQVLAL